jgi:hypothetical protein
MLYRLRCILHQHVKGALNTRRCARHQFLFASCSPWAVCHISLPNQEGELPTNLDPVPVRLRERFGCERSFRWWIALCGCLPAFVSRYAQLLAQFRTDVEGFVLREAVEACIAHAVYERGPLTEHRYAGFVDPSGGSADSMTLAVAHRERDRGSIVVDAVRWVRPPFSPEAVVREFAQVLNSYRISRVQGDRYAGEFPRELFHKFGITYEVSPKPKTDLYRGLLPLINSGRCELLDNAKLVGQLVGLERRVSRSSKHSVDHAPGGHDDLANACAGALLAALRAHKGRILRGECAYGGGPATWWDVATGEQIDPKTKEPIPRTRINVVRLTEKEAPAARGI